MSDHITLILNAKLSLSYTPRHRQERFHWATDKRNWHGTSSFLTKAVFCILTFDDRNRVWHRRRKLYSDDCVVERDSWGGPSIIVWGGIELFRKLGRFFCFCNNMRCPCSATNDIML